MAAYTLNDHIHSNNDSDDSKSTSSTISLERMAESCPCCKKEMQARVMFNHLRKLHPEYLKGMYCIWKAEQMDELIKYNAPFPVEWVVKDDFDEDVSKTLWGCLGCNNTYTTQHNAAKHCLGKCKKDHNAHLRRIKKEEQQDKEKHDKKLSTERMRWLNRTPQQIYACIQQDVAFFNKKWAEVGIKVTQYLRSMKHDNIQEYVFCPTMSPVFEDNKKKMEQQEKQIDTEMTKWRRMYQDILPLFWTANVIVSDLAYEEIEKKIMIGLPDYKF